MKILVVDDSRTDREIMKDYLVKAGYGNIRTVGSAEEAIALLGLPDSKTSEEIFDLILMDIVMPNMDGIKACGWIKSKGTFKDVPIIMVTARTEDKDLARAFEQGAVDYITKPINKTELLSRVSSALRLKKEIDNRKAHEQKMLRITEDLTKAFDHIRVQNRKLEEEIKERKRVEETLRSFEKAIETMQIGVTITDTNGDIVYVNPAEAAIHRYSQDELRGKNVRVFSPPALWKPLSLAQLRKVKSRKRESVNVKKDGTLFPVQLLSDVVKDVEGNVTGVVTTCEDITERKKVEEELRRSREDLEQKVQERTREMLALQAEAMRSAHLASLGELSAGVAHEINNPINGIINCAQILLNRFAGHHNEKEICAMIISEGKRVANIVQALLSFARERGGEKRPVHIEKVISDALALTAAHMRKDGIMLTIDIPDRLPIITGHHQQIQQVFLNLINNAHYALNQRYPKGDENKSLSISAEILPLDKKEFVRITFMDKGTGIPSDNLDKVMEPFFSTKPEDKGTGLGLSISHGIIADHGGRLSIESSECDFTKVTIDLPASR